MAAANPQRPRFLDASRDFRAPSIGVRVSVKPALRTSRTTVRSEPFPSSASMRCFPQEAVTLQSRLSGPTKRRGWGNRIRPGSRRQPAFPSPTTFLPLVQCPVRLPAKCPAFAGVSALPASSHLRCRNQIGISQIQRLVDPRPILAPVPPVCRRRSASVPQLASQLRFQASPPD